MRCVCQAMSIYGVLLQVWLSGTVDIEHFTRVFVRSLAPYHFSPSWDRIIQVIYILTNASRSTTNWSIASTITKIVLFLIRVKIDLELFKDYYFKDKSYFHLVLKSFGRKVRSGVTLGETLYLVRIRSQKFAKLNRKQVAIGDRATFSEIHRGPRFRDLFILVSCYISCPVPFHVSLPRCPEKDYAADLATSIPNPRDTKTHSYFCAMFTRHPESLVGGALRTFNPLATRDDYGRSPRDTIRVPPTTTDQCLIFALYLLQVNNFKKNSVKILMI